MLITEFLDKVRAGEPIGFNDTIDIIHAYYDYTPTEFCNGLGPDALINPAGVNEGSCKILSFASLHNLTETETLALFGDYYRQDVLLHPEGNNHQNIRCFMREGWPGIKFSGEALALKAN